MSYLQEVNPVSTAVRLLLALALGGILGFAREKKGRPAGLRTYMVVCVSSALVMITNQYMVTLYGNIDAARMGAQILSGIGFLGAGTIIITGRNKVKGLTTAAGLWAAACLGLAAGIGFYYGAIIGGVLIFIVMECLYRVDDNVLKHAQVIVVYVEFKGITHLSSFLSNMKEQNVRISDLEVKKTGELEEKDVAAIITMHFPDKVQHSEVISQITAMDGILFVEEV